jgi:hypothetical protein
MTLRSEDIRIPGTWVSKMIASPIFQKYLTSLSFNPADQRVLSEVSRHCVAVITRFFSIDFALDVKAFYDVNLYSKCASEEKISNPSDVIGYLDGNTYYIYIKPRDLPRESRELIVLVVVEAITKVLLRFLFPESTQATIDYYSTVVIFERIFNIATSDEEKQEVRLSIENVRKQKVQDMPQLTRLTSLSCPYCQSHSLELLGLQNTGTVEYKAGVPVLSGKKENIAVMAYYKCEKCKRVFYAQPEKVS